MSDNLSPPLPPVEALLKRWRDPSAIAAERGKRMAGGTFAAGLKFAADELEAALAAIPSPQTLKCGRGHESRQLKCPACHDVVISLNTFLGYEPSSIDPVPSPQTWQPENEHAGGSLNGPSRLGASPNTDTGGECVLVPRSLLTATLNLLGATSVGLHGTPWAQSEIQALIQALDRLLPKVAASPRGGPADK